MGNRKPSTTATALTREFKENTTEAYLSRAKDWACEVLPTAGLPDHLRAVRFLANGQWIEDLPKGWQKKKYGEFLKPDEGVGTLLGLVENRRDTPEWFAAHILRFATQTQHHMKSGDAESAAWNAIQLAQTIRQSHFKLVLKAPLETGIKVLQGARESGKETRADREARDERWCDEAEQLRTRHPEWSRENIIREILKNDLGKENGKSWKRATVRRALIKKLSKPGE